jgi:hypothetical protein
MNSLRPLILSTPCIIPRLLWTCLRIPYPRSYSYSYSYFRIPPPPGGTAILPEYIHYYG